MESSELNNSTEHSLNFRFPICDVGVWSRCGIAVWGVKNIHIHCKALTRCSASDIGICFCPPEKFDAINADIGLERTRLLPTSLPVFFFFFPLKDKLKMYKEIKRERWFLSRKFSQTMEAWPEWLADFELLLLSLEFSFSQYTCILFRSPSFQALAPTVPLTLPRSLAVEGQIPTTWAPGPQVPGSANLAQLAGQHWGRGSLPLVPQTQGFVGLFQAGHYFHLQGPMALP